MIVGDIYADSVEVLGRCSQAQIFNRLTEAIALLANKGDWDPLIGYVDICSGTDYRTITLPKDIDTPLAVNIDGRPMFFRNKWFEFHLNGAGSMQETGWTWDDVGQVPIFQDILQPSTLVAIAQLQNDLGTVIQIFGYDQLGRWIRTQNPDGTWIDGYNLTVNNLTDFPQGVIQPNTVRYFYRILNNTPLYDLTSTTGPHNFVTGASGTIALITPPLPVPLIVNTPYFIRADSPTTVSLHATLQSAQTNASPIQLTSVGTNSVVSLTDSRQVQVQTKFTSATPLNFLPFSEVTFTGSPLPTPITTSDTFFLNLLDNENFTIHGSQKDAQNAANPLFVSSAGANVVANADQIITPYTQLSFSVPHNFLSGDAVTIANAGGALPSPLLPSVTYYVGYISPTVISLHQSLSDAVSLNNPIILTDNGQGSSSVVKLIPASVNIGAANNINAANHNISVGQFVQFQSSGTLPTPLSAATVYQVQNPMSQNTFTLSNTSFSQIAVSTRRRSNNIALLTTTQPHNLVTGDFVNITGVGGTGYNLTQAQITVTDPNSFTYPSTGANEGIVGTNSVNRCRALNFGYITTATAHGLTSGQSVNIQNLGGANYNLPYVPVTVLSTTAFKYSDTGINEGGAGTSQVARASNVATITTALSHGFSNGTLVNVVGVGGGFDTDQASVTVVDSFNFTYSNTGPNVSTTTNVNGYCAAGISDTGGIIAAGVSDSGQVNYNVVNITTIGTGQLDLVISRAFTISFNGNWFVDASNLTTGAPFNLTSSGVLPAAIPALSPLTTYYARVIDPLTIEIFTSSANALDTTVRRSASIARTSNVATVVTQSAHGFATNDYVTITSFDDTSYNAVNAQITVTNGTTFTYSSTGNNESTTTDTTGLIARAPILVTSLGAGETQLVLTASVTVTFLSQDLAISSSSYLNNGTQVQFTTTGTLPAPLAVSTSYLINVETDGIQVTDLSGNVIVLTSIGSGTQTLNHTQNFNVEPPTQFQVPNNEYTTGDSVTLATQGTPPTPLVNGTTYFIRRLNSNEIELYDTLAHATDLSSTVGRLVALDQGSGEQDIGQILPAIQVLKIDRVFISNTPRNGFIDLYAWDYGREHNLTLIGNYYPDESEPKYRRIKTLNTCKWIRMRYRRKTYTVTSLNDYIPLNSKTGILMMLKSMEFYRTDFADEGKRYEDLATQFMLEEHKVRQGPESIIIQVNPQLMGDDCSLWIT